MVGSLSNPNQTNDSLSLLSWSPGFVDFIARKNDRVLNFFPEHAQKKGNKIKKLSPPMLIACNN